MNNTPTPRTDFAISASNGQWSYVLKLCAEELERELTAAREEIEMMGIRYAAAEMHHANNMQEVIEQLTAAREELAELKEEYGTWWAQKRIAIDELKEVTEQRDRLAEACKLLMAIVGEPNSSVDSCWASEDEMDAAWNMGNEALAAAKGGSHES